MPLWKIAAVLAVMTVTAAAQAEPAASPCSARGAPLPTELAGWNAPRPATAATSGDGLPKAVLKPGMAVDAALSPAGGVRYAVAPGKPGAADSHGGLFTFDVDAAGSYRVALGAAAWVDVIEGGRAVASSAHGHGPECSGIRKMVDFRLRAGRHILQIAGNGSPAIRVMVTRLR